MKINEKKFSEGVHQIARLTEEIRREINRHSNRMLDLDLKVAQVKFNLQEAIEKNESGKKRR